MLNRIADLIKDKKVLILGFGREGRSTFSLINRVGGFRELAIADQKAPEDVSGLKIHSGEGYLDCLNDYDVVFKSPGVVLPQTDYSCVLTSQVELFLEKYSRQVIGITGTKGKSTVSSLMYHVLSENGVPCLFAGNIGLPVFEIVPEIRPETVVVLELSCHQLEYCRYSPELALLLNLYEDHLDHYGTMEKYVRAKKNIYLNQRPLDLLLCIDEVRPAKEESVSRTVAVTSDVLPFRSFSEVEGARLRGEHNLLNCAFVYTVAKTFGISGEEFISSLKTFSPLRHRLELIGEKDGVEYFDDSISTTVESAISAMESVANASTILLGGMDRGIEYDKLVSYLRSKPIKNVICMYDSGRRIYDMLSEEPPEGSNLLYRDDLESAVSAAKEVTGKGEACILSPASASYGYFTNFEERGDVFKSLALE